MFRKQRLTSFLFFITVPAILAIGCTNGGKTAKLESTINVTTTIKKVDSKKVDDFVLAEMNRLKIPGVSIAVAHGGSMIYKNCYGSADLEHSISVTPQSPFKIASLTKPITAIAIMQLVENGKLLLDEKVGLYVDSLPKEWNSITIRQLLSHTSGLADYFQSPDWSWKNSWRLHLSHDEFIKMCEKSLPIFKPGEKMKYCNTGYYLLGMVIEKISEMSYGAYLKRHIFEPLGMSNTRLDNAESIISGRVRGYTLTEGELRNSEFTSDTWAYSEGGVITTTEDLSKLDSSLYTEALLKKISIEQLWTPTKLNNGSDGIIGDNGAGMPNHYGLGWFISDYKNHKLILAGGNKPGYSCICFRFIENDLTVIILSNLSSAPVYGIAGEIAEMYLTM